MLADKVSAARVLDGVAEPIPLVGESSVAAVMIADALRQPARPRRARSVGCSRVAAGWRCSTLCAVPDWSGAS